MRRMLILPLILCAGFAHSSATHGQDVDLFSTYSDEARDLVKEGKYLEAASTFRIAIELEKATPSPRTALIRTMLREASDCCRLVGRYDEAVKYDRELLELSRAQGDKRAIFSAHNRVGYSCRRLGRYDEALENYETALQIGEEMGVQDPVLVSNIALLYHLWGQDEKAVGYMEQSLDMSDELQDVDLLQPLNLSQIYLELNQPERAFEFARKCSRGGKSQVESEVTSIDCLVNMIRIVEGILRIDPEVAEEKNLSLVRSFSETLGDNDIYIFPDEEEHFIVALYKKILDEVRGARMDAAVARVLNEIGRFYHYSAGVDERAFRYYQEALGIDRRAGREDWVAVRLKNLGQAHMDRTEFVKALDYLKEAVEILEKLRQTATGSARRDYLASQIDTYQKLISCYARTGDFASAFRTIELSRAKLLAERLAGSRAEVPALSIEEVQREIGDHTAVLVYANIDRIPREKMVQLTLTSQDVRGEEVPCSSFVAAALDQHGTGVNSVLGQQRGLAKIRPQKEKFREKEEEKAADFEEFAAIINYYRFLLTNPSPENETLSRKLGQALYDILIEPSEKVLREKARLVIVPDGVLGFLPFETLIDEKGRYLAETHSVVYAQSMGVWKLVGDRQYEESRDPLLAMGGAVYDRITYDVDMLENERQLAYLEHQVDDAMSTRGSMRGLYASLGVAEWDNLPGTLSEVRAIEKIVPEADLLTGEQVDEGEIKRLSSGGRLARYRVLHFATHGLVVLEVPELSALVLSQFRDERDSEDGYLRMEEISALDLQADFVSLSACETGLGKIYGGEGVVGLTQSFLIAGANSLSVSLWQVADESTAQFMVKMYELVEREGMGYADAITEVKRRFARGEYGEEWKMPYYWAPFVYYGQ